MSIFLPTSDAEKYRNQDPVAPEPTTSAFDRPSYDQQDTGPVGPQGPYGQPMQPPSTGNPELDARLGTVSANFGDRNVPNYTAGESIGYGLDALMTIPRLLDSPRGATAAAFTPDTGMGVAERAQAGFLRPEQYPFRNAAGIRNLSDSDITVGDLSPVANAIPVVGPAIAAATRGSQVSSTLSPRDVVGGVADIALDPSNYLPLGALAGRGDDALRAAGRGVVNEVADSSTRGILRSVDGAPGAVQRATDVAFRPRISGASDDTAEAVRKIADSIIPGEKPSIGLLRRYEGTVNATGLQIRKELDAGNRVLDALGVGKPTGASRIADRTPELESLYKALHGEGPVPERFQGVYDALKASVDAETQASVGFDPKFMAHPDYFPRGWKEIEVGKVGSVQNPGSGVMGATPGFKKPRVEDSFSDILSRVYTRDDGSTFRLEPASWNPFEQLALRKIAGVEYREQTALIDKMKLSGVAVPVDGPVPNGYRIPQVGPAFEGKPKVAPGVDGQPPSFFGFTDRYAVPDNVADVLENMYGRKPNLGNLVEGVLNAGQQSKRVKLLASLFQQVDFTTRTGMYTTAGAIDDLLSGKPIEAVSKVAKLPVELGRLVAANLSPKRREFLRDEILSGKPVFPERPGVSLKGIAEAGWNQQDISIQRRDIRTAIRESVQGESLTAAAKRNLQRIEAANSRGLFDGVYPQAQIISLKNWVLPRLIRQHPDWTDEQIMGSAANEINKAFSTLGDYQTIFKNPYVQHLTRGLIFSTNEPEALLRGAGSAFYGPNKRLWAEAYAGGFLFLATVANLVHSATTTLLDGAPQPLPVDRYNPVRKNDQTPLGYSYNSKFLSPDTPLTAGGRRLALDLMGQMDTSLRVLDPLGFVSGRLNTIPRAIVNQVKGKDYFDNPIDNVGPKGVVSRVAQLASDLYEPIGAGNLRSAAGLTLGPQGPVGTAGGVVQAAGINLRPESSRDAVARGAYADLTGESQLEAIPQQSWQALGAHPNLPPQLAPVVAAYPNVFEWKNALLDEYRTYYVQQGATPSTADYLAKQAVERHPLAQYYGNLKNYYESQWVNENPQLAERVLQEDASKPPDKQRLTPARRDRATIQAGQ